MKQEKLNDYIDTLTYRQMLELWRFAPAGHPLFMGETGIYFTERMSELKKDVDHVKISKEIGWE